MYPNSQDVLPLPLRPSLEQYRKQSKELVRDTDRAVLRSYRQLVRAGAVVNPDWIDDNAARTPFARKLQADARMLAALTGGRS
jgi:hypothetical protein